MTLVMKQILHRVLIDEINRQYDWKEQEVKEFGFDGKERDDIIAEIRQFIRDNGIEEGSLI